MRFIVAVLTCVFAVACGGAAPASAPLPGLPSLAGAETPEDVRARMGGPCTTEENPAFPMGLDWAYCLERYDTGQGAGWRVATCAPECPELRLTFVTGRLAHTQTP